MEKVALIIFKFQYDNTLSIGKLQVAVYTKNI